MPMKYLKIAWNEFVYGGHLLSLGLVSVVYTISLILSIKVTLDFLLIVYLGTESVFLYNRYKELKIDFLSNPERTEHVKRHIKEIRFIVFLFPLILFIILIYNKNFPGLIFAAFLILLGFFYSKFLKKITQKIIGFKDFFVALIGGLLVFFLMIYYAEPINPAFFLFFIFVFLKCFVNTTFFDIKDIEIDKKMGLKTLAVVFGQDKLIRILGVITILTMMPLIIGVYFEILPILSLALFLTVPYTFLYFEQLENKKIASSFLYNVIVDGEFLFWPIFVFLGNFILNSL